MRHFVFFSSHHQHFPTEYYLYYHTFALSVSQSPGGLGDGVQNNTGHTRGPGFTDLNRTGASFGPPCGHRFEAFIEIWRIRFWHEKDHRTGLFSIAPFIIKKNSARNRILSLTGSIPNRLIQINADWWDDFSRRTRRPALWVHTDLRGRTARRDRIMKKAIADFLFFPALTLIGAGWNNVAF